MKLDETSCSALAIPWAAATPRSRWFLVWVHERCQKPESEAFRAALQREVHARGGRINFMKKAHKFATWLNHSVSAACPYILLTDWREVKPCLEAASECPASRYPTSTFVVAPDERSFLRATAWSEEQPERMRISSVFVTRDVGPPQTFVDTAVGLLPDAADGDREGVRGPICEGKALASPPGSIARARAPSAADSQSTKSPTSSKWSGPSAQGSPMAGSPAAGSPTSVSFALAETPEMPTLGAPVASPAVLHALGSLRHQQLVKMFEDRARVASTDFSENHDFSENFESYAMERPTRRKEKFASNSSSLSYMSMASVSTTSSEYYSRPRALSDSYLDPGHMSRSEPRPRFLSANNYQDQLNQSGPGMGRPTIPGTPQMPASPMMQCICVPPMSAWQIAEMLKMAQPECYDD